MFLGPRPPHRFTGTIVPGLTQPGHGSSAKAPQRRLSRSRHASADTMKTARAGREGHVASLGATKRATSARSACRQALLLTRGASHSYPHLLLLIRGGVAPPAGSSGFPHIYFAVALGDLSGRARDPETAASVADEVVSSQPPRASVRVSQRERGERAEGERRSAGGARRERGAVDGPVPNTRPSPPRLRSAPAPPPLPRRLRV